MEQKIIKSSMLLPFLEASYREEYTEYARKNLRCSDAGAAADEGEKCEREIFYDLTCPEKKQLLSTGSLAMFDDGRLHEADIRRRLRLILRSPERELTDDEIGARGKIDNMVDARKFPTDMVWPTVGLDGDPILEIKTINEYQFHEIAAKGIVPQTHYDQIQYYLYLSGVKWAVLLIKNRNASGATKGGMPYLEFIITSDKKRQDEIRAGLKTTKECAIQGIIPPRPFLRDSAKCSYCRFKFTCWGQDVAKAELKPDESVEKPSQEILEGALMLYNTTQKQIAELDKQKAEARSVLERYFKATGESEILVKNVKGSYTVIEKTKLDRAYLLSELGPVKFAIVSNPDRKLIEKAIEDRKIDAGVYDRAKIKEPGTAQIRVSALKETGERIKDNAVQERPSVEPGSEKKNKRGSKRKKK